MCDHILCIFSRVRISRLGTRYRVRGFYHLLVDTLVATLTRQLDTHPSHRIAWTRDMGKLVQMLDSVCRYLWGLHAFAGRL